MGRRCYWFRYRSDRVRPEGEPIPCKDVRPTSTTRPPRVQYLGLSHFVGDFMWVGTLT